MTRTFAATDLASTVTVTIGNGGAAGVPGAAGAAGAVSSFFFIELIPFIIKKRTKAIITKLITAERNMPYFTAPKMVKSSPRIA